MIRPDEWELLVHNELSEKGLVSWITPVDPSSDDYRALEGVLPPVPRTDPAFKDWHRSYCKVSAAMTRSLGKDMMRVVRQPEYVALYSFCPALQRYRAIRSILDPGFTIVSGFLMCSVEASVSDGSKRGIRTEAEECTQGRIRGADRIKEPSPISNSSASSRPLPCGTSDSPSTLARRTRQSDTNIPPYPSSIPPKRIILKPLLELARAGLAERAAANALAGQMASTRQKTAVDLDQVVSLKKRVDLKRLKKERTVKNEWGERCWTCGRMGTADLDTHTTKKCTATHLSVVSTIPVMTRYVERPSKHGGKPKPRLAIVGGPDEKRGDQICYRWQYERTLDVYAIARTAPSPTLAPFAYDLIIERPIARLINTSRSRLHLDHYPYHRGT